MEALSLLSDFLIGVRMRMKVVLLILGFVCSIGTSPAQAVDLRVAAGQQILLGSGDHVYENVEIAKGGVLRFSGPVRLTCNRMILAGAIYLKGDSIIEVNWGLLNPSSTEYAMKLGTGDNNWSYDNGIFYDFPESAASAQQWSGLLGSDGIDGYDLTLIVHGILSIHGYAQIKLNGQNGGNGASGSDGFSGITCQNSDFSLAWVGGNGGNGGNGGRFKAIVSGRVDRYDQMGIGARLFHYGKGGNGGSGGAGCIGSTQLTLPGARGGDGGRSGSGGSLFLSSPEIDPYVLLENVDVSGGVGGRPGNGGPGTNVLSPHRGLTGQPGGTGGQINILAMCSFRPSLSNLKANGGMGGAASTPGQVNNWDCSDGLKGLDNDTGIGGQGGTIQVSAANLSSLTMNSRGGQGGQGGTGGDTWCGTLGGNGGAGATGGDGGAIAVQADTVDDPTVSEDISGGLGGEGGLGNSDPPGNAGSQGSPGVAGSSTQAPRGDEVFSSSLSADRDTALPGDYITYLVTVSTTEPQTNAVLSLALPFDKVEVDSATGPYRLESGAIRWDFATLAGCSSATYKVKIRVFCDVSPGTVLAPQATLVSDQETGKSSETVRTEILAEPEPIRVPAHYGLDNDSQEGPDPVHTGIGNFYWHKRLFSMPGKTMGIDFSVTYNSLDTSYNGPLGFGWTHAYNIVLKQDLGLNETQIKWGDGHIDYFKLQNGAYTSVGCATETKLADNTGSGWVATLENGVQYIFNASGRLTQITDRQGNKILLSYAGSDLTRITDQAGRSIDFSYTGGKLTSVAAPASMTLGFSLDGASGNLTRITDPRNANWDFNYEAGTHRLSGIDDRTGRTVLVQDYYPDGRVHTQTDGDGRTTTYVYDDKRRTTDIVPPGGNTVRHVFDLRYNQIQVVDGTGSAARFSFSDKGKRLSAKDKMGQLVNFGYDANGNLNSYRDRAGSSISAVYNSANLATKVTDALGKATNMAYDGNGNLTNVTDALRNSHTVTYNSVNQVLDYTDPRGHTSRRTYTPEGLVETTTDNLGNVLTRTYDAAGRLVRLDFPTTPASHQMIAYDASGNVIGKTDRLGISSESAYNANGNVISRVLDPGGINATTAWQYDNLGQISRVTDATGGVTLFSYDTDGNVRTMTDPDGITLTYSYDKRNRLTAVSDKEGNTKAFVYDENGRVRTITGPLGNSVSYEYDPEGRLTKVTDPLGHVTSKTYDALGRVITTTDALGRTTSLTYDAVGRVTQIQYPDGNTVSSQYDANGNRTRLTNQKGHSWTFEYDAMDRPTRMIDPLGGAQTFNYDAMGNTVSSTDRNGNQTSYAYDLDDRLVSKTLPGSITYNYTYDHLGRMTRISDPSGTTTMTYDKNGRKTGVADTTGKLVSYGYTPAGRLASITYPGSKILQYAYNTLGRLATITDWNSKITTFTYDGAGRLTRTNLPNGCYTEYAYDQAGRVTRLAHRKGDNAVIVGYAFTRNAIGQLTQMTTSGEPVSSTDPKDATYAYSDADRILTQQTNGVTVNYTFDANGNLTGRNDGATTTTYTYDTLNRLIQVGDGSHATTYAYDGHGNRIAKSYDGRTLRYLKDGRNVLCTYDNSGIQQYFIHAGGGLLYSADTAGNIQVYHGDPQGSVAAVTDQSEAIIGTYLYDPYGKEVGGTGSLDNPHRYVGIHGVMRDENGLYHMQHRYYDPDIKRFLTEDPIGLAGGLNLYRYGAGDPINLIDPSGLKEGFFTLQKTPYRMGGLTVDPITGQKTFTPITYGVDYHGVTYVHQTEYEAVKTAQRMSVEYSPGPEEFMMENPAVPYFAGNEGYAGPVTPGKEIALAEPQVTALAIPEAKTTALAVPEVKSTALVKPSVKSHPLAVIEKPSVKTVLRGTTTALEVIPASPAVYTVDRFTFFYQKIGIQLENAIIRTLGTTGLRVAMVGAKVLNAAAWLFTAADVGWMVGTEARGWTVWDSTSGRWMTLDDWVANRIDEWDNGDWENQNLGIEYYRMVEKIKLKEYTDELNRVWSMKP